jgi:hypothetical protein
VRANAVSPSANTRLVKTSAINVPESGSADLLPEGVSPLVLWLAEEGCLASDQVFQVYGRAIGIYSPTQFSSILSTQDMWTPEELDRTLPQHLTPTITAEDAIALVAEKP